jgi:hypothetical protein
VEIAHLANLIKLPHDLALNKLSQVHIMLHAFAAVHLKCRQMPSQLGEACLQGTLIGLGHTLEGMPGIGQMQPDFFPSSQISEKFCRLSNFQ